MDTTAVFSQTTSLCLHAVFMVLAFLAPVHTVLEPTAAWARGASTEHVAPQRHATFVRTPISFADFSRMNAEPSANRGQGSTQGPKPQARVKSRPAEPSRSLALAADVTENLRGVIDGFGWKTTGPDARTVAGLVDDGGAGAPPLTIGGMDGFGRGSCGAGVVRTVHKGKVVATRRARACGTRTAMVAQASIGKILARRQMPAPRLGGKSEKIMDCGSAGPCLQLISDEDDDSDWRDVIRGVIERHKRELKYCYDRALTRNGPRFAPEVQMSLTIEPSGGVPEADLSATGAPTFDDCLAERVSRFEFPATGKHIVANYPLRFHAL